MRARYPDAARPALDGVSLRIPRGSVTAIVGPSGAGKSTVANVLLGLLTPEEGDISIAAPAGAVPDNYSYLRIQCSSQARSAKTLPSCRPTATTRRCWEHSCVHGATELASLSGLDAQVGDGGSLLSGGQRQRASIARALLRGSPVLLLDEASSALDARRERALLDGLRTTAQENDLTVIIIAHRLTAIRSADLIIVMDRGHVHEQGTYDALAACRRSLYEPARGSERTSRRNERAKIDAPTGDPTPRRDAQCERSLFFRSTLSMTIFQLATAATIGLSTTIGDEPSPATASAASSSV